MAKRLTVWLDTYAQEREYAADENILNSTRQHRFHHAQERCQPAFRNAVLTLAKDCAFARRMVNSGRLSVATTLRDTPLNTPDADEFAAGLPPGSVASDAPVMVGNRKAWFLHLLAGQFTTVYFAAAKGTVPKSFPTNTLVVLLEGVARVDMPGAIVVEDDEGLLAQRLDARPGTTYLFRPDQHVCARWHRFDPDLVRAALARAMAHA